MAQQTLWPALDNIIRRIDQASRFPLTVRIINNQRTKAVPARSLDAFVEAMIEMFSLRESSDKEVFVRYRASESFRRLKARLAVRDRKQKAQRIAKGLVLDGR